MAMMDDGGNTPLPSHVGGDCASVAMELETQTAAATMTMDDGSTASDDVIATQNSSFNQELLPQCYHLKRSSSYVFKLRNRRYNRQSNPFSMGLDFPHDMVRSWNMTYASELQEDDHDLSRLQKASQAIKVAWEVVHSRIPERSIEVFWLEKFFTGVERFHLL